MAIPISELPTREGWPDPLVLYKNYWLRAPVASNIARAQDADGFKPRHDDIILATNPKCGTTWLKALGFAVAHRSRYEHDGAHPLLTRHPHELVPSIETPLNRDPTSVERLPSPRLLATNLPLSVFPDGSMLSSGCRIVYMCRDPKDALVSRWHFEKRISAQHPALGLEDAFAMFCEGFTPCGPFWDHCLEYWRASLARPDRVLFLRYEEMMADPVKHVTRLAAFLGVPFTAKEQEDGAPDELVRLCSFDKLRSLRPNQEGYLFRGFNLDIERSAFFRKGKVGDWANHMSQEMGAKLDRIVREKLQGSGLVL